MRLQTGLSPAEDGVDVPGLNWNGVLGHGQECGGVAGEAEQGH